MARRQGKKTRAHVDRPRCLYTGVNLDDTSSDEAKIPSLEHIIPLSLGGVNAFAVPCVARKPNNLAGNEIDDRLASQPLFLRLRQGYRLTGHRGTLPTIRFDGKFADIGREAWMEIDHSGAINWGFPNSERVQGPGQILSGSEDQVRQRLAAMLRQAQRGSMRLTTPHGDITDADDIELALQLADYETGETFATRLHTDLREYEAVLGRFAIKVALCAGFKVLGPQWAFSPSGILLRRALFADDSTLQGLPIHGHLRAELPMSFRDALDIREHRHLVAVLPLGSTCVAIVSLFGGMFGHAVIDLGRKSTGTFHSPTMEAKPVECVFTIDLDPQTGKRSYNAFRFQDVADKLDPVAVLLEQIFVSN